MHISHILVFIILTCTKKHVIVIIVLFALVTCWYLQPTNSSPGPFWSNKLDSGLEKSSKLKSELFHTWEYYQDVRENLKFEYVAVVKTGIKDTVFFFNKFQTVISGTFTNINLLWMHVFSCQFKENVIIFHTWKMNLQYPLSVQMYFRKILQTNYEFGNTILHHVNEQPADFTWIFK